MNITPLTEITTHVEDALGRLLEQYKGKARFEAIVTQFGLRTQTLESVFAALFNERSLTASVGAQLDGLGQIVDQPRNGLTDEIYRIRLFAKIAQNVSKSTPEDLIGIFKLLMQANKVYYYEVYPAAVYMTAIGGTPIGDTSEIRKAVNDSRAGGVSIDLLSTADDNAFSFLEDPDPDGRGFGVLSDPDEGGFFARLL